MKAQSFVRTVSILLVAGAAALAAQAGGETFKATAGVKSPSASASTAVTFHIDRFATEAERDRIVAAVKTNDAAAIHKALADAPDVGYIAVSSGRTPIKYAYARSTGGGRLITLVAAKPVAYVGASAPDAKPKGAHDLALALLVLDDKGSGDGELSPAVTIKMDEKGAIVTSDYSREVVRLTGISKVK